MWTSNSRIKHEKREGLSALPLFHLKLRFVARRLAASPIGIGGVGTHPPLPHHPPDVVLLLSPNLAESSKFGALYFVITHDRRRILQARPVRLKMTQNYASLAQRLDSFSSVSRMRLALS